MCRVASARSRVPGGNDNDGNLYSCAAEVHAHLCPSGTMYGMSEEGANLALATLVSKREETGVDAMLKIIRACRYLIKAVLGVCMTTLEVAQAVGKRGGGGGGGGGEKPISRFIDIICDGCGMVDGKGNGSHATMNISLIAACALLCRKPPKDDKGGRLRINYDKRMKERFRVGEGKYVFSLTGEKEKQTKAARLLDEVAEAQHKATSSSSKSSFSTSRQQQEQQQQHVVRRRDLEEKMLCKVAAEALWVMHYVAERCTGAKKTTKMMFATGEGSERGIGAFETCRELMLRFKNDDDVQRNACLVIWHTCGERGGGRAKKAREMGLVPVLQHAVSHFSAYGKDATSYDLAKVVLERVKKGFGQSMADFFGF